MEYGGSNVITAFLNDQTVTLAVSIGDFVHTVILRGGIYVSRNGLRLPWDCERRQCRMRIIGR